MLASAKACDAIMAVRIPETAVLLRELIHCAQFVQSHALSFFHLSAPDLLLGMDFDPARRNIIGLIDGHPEMARSGIALRKFGQQVIEGLAKERVHPSWAVPGGVNAPLSVEVRDRTLAELPAARTIATRTLEQFKRVLDGFSEEIANFGNLPTLYAGLVNQAGGLEFYEGGIRFVNPDLNIVADQVTGGRYADYIAEASLPNSYLKAPFFKPLGYPAGAYRVGPLARLNAAERCGTAQADAELDEYRQRYGRVVHSAFHYHYARLIELIHGLEKLELLLNHPRILDTTVRAHASVNFAEGIGIIEAPRGTLIHHYKVDDTGGIRWANLVVATGHNNLALNRSIVQVSRHFVDGTKLQEGMLNRISAVVRAYDPCLSCSTHADGTVAMVVRLVAPDGEIVDELAS
jgi:NAD-reducing hydrogenase large subunit